ncbi:MAG: hypothetical protein K0S47_2494 [Herbinix sp.]|nr:hypothetical protein [Herbinix sp.]
MDYSRKGIDHKQHYIKSTSRRMVSKARISLFRVFIAFTIFLAIVGVLAGLGFIKGLIDSAPDISQINVIPTGYTTTIYDKDGNVIENLIGAHANRVYVKVDEIPDYVEKAFVAIEDERFYEHNGIDVRGIFRAFFLGLSKGDFDQGASTITQQLLKNQVFNGGREQAFIDRVERKVQEQYLAIQLEDRESKDKILEYYLNTINLGAGTYGVQTASKRYFNKDVDDLTISEAAVIAAIAQLPVYRNPITYPERNAERRSSILTKMLELGYCTQAEYDEAIADDEVYARIQSLNEEVDSTSYYTYFVDEVITQVMEALQSELGYTQTQASTLLYSGGLFIYTTQDPVIQGICDDVYADESFFPEMGVSYWELTYALSIQKKDGTTIHLHSDDFLDYYKDFKDPDGLYVDDNDSKFSLLFTDKEDMQKKVDAYREAMVEEGDTILAENAVYTLQPQSSFVVMDQHTGYVSAIIGGRGVKQGNRILNRATNAKRQPGSTFKILSTYLPAFDIENGFTLADVQDDAPFKYPGEDKEVSNWTSTKKYDGLTTLRKAIWNSMNIVTVKTLNQVTPEVGYNYLLDLGFTTLVDNRTEPNGNVVSDINLSMALGGITDGVYNMELTAAYAAIANKGIYTEPILFTKIVDHNGKVLLENTPVKKQVMRDSTAWLLTNAMEDVVKVGTGKNLRLTAIDMPVAGKTGTTSDYKDLWFSGYSPYYTATIWSGFDNPRTQTDKKYHQVIWRTIMERIHMDLNLETQSFEMPDSVVAAKICTKSGKLAVEGLCDHALGGDTTRIEYFAKGTAPIEKCDVHVKAKICTASGDLATDNCPSKYVKEEVFLIKEETHETADTPNILPSDNCKLHKTPVYEDDISVPTIPVTPDDEPIYEDEPNYEDGNEDDYEDEVGDEFEDDITNIEDIIGN